MSPILDLFVYRLTGFSFKTKEKKLLEVTRGQLREHE